MSEHLVEDATDDAPEVAVTEHTAKVIYPGAIKGRPTLELRIRPDGSNEAFLVPSGGTPIARQFFSWLMPCSTRIRRAVWVRRSASWAAARAGRPGSDCFAGPAAE
jgi:hypothetical protein